MHESRKGGTNVVGNICHWASCAIVGRFNINFAPLAEDSNIGIVGMCKCHDFHVVGPSSALGHLIQMALESHVQLVLGCSREVQVILGRDAPSALPLRG